MIWIDLTKGYRLRVDDEDADLGDFNWTANYCGTKVYAYRRKMVGGKYTAIYLHRVIGERKFGLLPKGMRIEHDNWNTMDNCRENIKLITHAANITHKDLVRSPLWCPPGKAWGS